MGKQKGGIKLRRCAKKKAYYTQQHNVTARNKARRAMKRVKRQPQLAKPVSPEQHRAQYPEGLGEAERNRS